MACAMKLQSGRLLASQEMTAFKGAVAGAGGLWSSVSATLLRRLNARPLKSALLVSGEDAQPRVVVLLLQSGRVQLAGLVPVVDTLSQRWLLNGVEVHRRLQWVVQSSSHHQVLISRAPILDPNSPEWQQMRALLEEAPLGASEQEQLEALAEAAALLQRYPVDLQPGAGALQQWAVVCRGPESAQVGLESMDLSGSPMM